MSRSYDIEIAQDIEDQILDDFFVHNLNRKTISKKYKLPLGAISRLIDKQATKAFDHHIMNKVMSPEDYNPLTFFDNLYKGGISVGNGLNFHQFIINNLQKMIMDEIAQSDGVEALLTSDRAKDLFDLLEKNTEKILKFIQMGLTVLKEYKETQKDIIEGNKQIALTRVMMDVLAELAPEDFKKVQAALYEHPAARAVMASLDPDKIMDYFETGDSIPAQVNRKHKGRREENE